MEQKTECQHHHKNEPHLKTNFLQVTAISENQQEAEELIGLLTKKRIVACAQVQGPKSVCQADEKTWRCRFKTSKDLFPQVEKELSLFFQTRKYSVNTLPIVKGSPHFLNWLADKLQSV